MATAMSRSPVLPVAAACLGIALFAGMDAAMKGVSLAIGAYSALLWRQAMGAALAGLPYLVTRERWPGRAAMRFHLVRGAVGALTATTWFWGLARLPMAEAIALSFIAPLIALFLAAVLLGEKIGQSSIAASLLGLAGVVLLGARLSVGEGPRHLDGVVSILVSAVFYGWNIVLMRQQAQVASPMEVAFFQNAVAGGWLLIALPVVLALRPEWVEMPSGGQWPLLALSAILTVLSLFLLSWAYGRAEAQVLVPVEYTAFVWGAVMGAIFYAETLGWTTLVGAVLIVTGCLIAARGSRPVVAVAA